MVYSADRIPGAEALSTQNRLAALLSYKLKQEYSEMCGVVQARMSLAIVRSNIQLLRSHHEKGARIWKQPVMALIVPWAWLNLGVHDGKDEKGQIQGHGTGVR